MDCKATCTIGANIAQAAFVGPDSRGFSSKGPDSGGNYNRDLKLNMERWAKYAKIKYNENKNDYYLNLLDEIDMLLDGSTEAKEKAIRAFLKKNGRIASTFIRENYDD